jgi:outer membrane immunogenic protein
MIAAAPTTATRSVTEHIFRTGINYHFNSPVVAKY